jgi:DNA polymerase-3 subunit alpha
VNDSLIEKMTLSIPLNLLDDTFVAELDAILSRNPGKVPLFVKVCDTDDNLYVDMKATQVKISVDKEVMTYLSEKPELSYRIN